MLIQKADQHFQLSTNAYNTQIPGESLVSISKQTSATLRLVDCIVRENNCLSQQIKHIESQILKARPLSLNLLKQNENMRKMYHERTQDIKKIIQTISINNDENKTDFEHQCFLFKQLNCSTLKNIKLLDKQRGMVNQRLNQIKRKFQELSLLKNELQNQSLTKLKVRLGKGKNSNSGRTLERQYEIEQDKLTQTYNQVNQLIVQNHTIKRQIAVLRRNDQPNRQSLQINRDQFQHRLIQAKKSVANYTQQLKNDQIDFQRAHNQRNEKEERAKKINKALMEQVKKYQRLQAQWTNSNQEREKCKQKINLSMKNKLKLESKLETVKDQKQQLQYKINQIKLRIQHSYIDQNQKDQAAEKIKTQTIKKFKTNISTSQNDSNVQSKKILAQLKKVQKSIEILNQDYETLEDEVQQYKKTIRGYPNPIAQIERIQLIFRLKRAR